MRVSFCFKYGISQKHWNIAILWKNCGWIGWATRICNIFILLLTRDTLKCFLTLKGWSLQFVDLELKKKELSTNEP